MVDIPVTSNGERSGPSRVVEVRAEGSFGTGYAVTADLVLTARHCLSAESTGCRVRRLGDYAWRDATVVWRGSGSVDAALIRVSGVPWADDPDVRWTRWAVPSGDGVPCTAWGFPRTQRREDESGRTVRDVETVTGWIDSVTGFKMNRYSLNIVAPHPQARTESEWRGMSGAVLCAGTDRDRRAGQLLGVVTTDPAAYEGRRLEAVGVAVLLLDPEFARLVGAGPSDVEEVTADPVPLLDRMLRDPFDTLPSDASDWWRLQSRFAEVPFLGRGDALRRLTSWCLDAEPVAPRFSIGLITGDGGSGKTRLAGQLCVDLRAKGWAAGFCGAETLTRLRSQGERPDAARPTLVVVDYPEPLITMIAGLVTGLAVRDHGPPVRLLLVARDGPAAERDNWWKQLTDATGGYLSGDRPHVVELNDEPLSLVDRALHARAALAAFGGVDGRALPSLDDPAYGNTLRLHLAVLLACRGEDVAAADGVLRQFLRHETKQWCHDWLVHRHAPGTGTTAEPLPPVAAAERQALLRAVAAVALIAPHRDRLPEMLATLPGTPAPEDAAWLAGLFPATDETVAFGPDILTATLLDTVEDLPSLVEALYAMVADSASDLTRLLEAMQLAASHARVEAALAALVTGHFCDLVQRALTDPDTALSDTVTGVLRLLCRDPSRAEALAALAVEDAVPSHGYLVLRTALGDLRVTGLREAEEPVDPAVLAGQLSALATHAAELGRHSEAAERALEAVTAFEQAGATGEDYGLAAHNAAAALLTIDQPRRAMEYAKKAVEALPENAVGARLEAGVTVLANRLAVGEPTRDVVSGMRALAAHGVVDRDFDEMLDGLAHFADWRPLPAITGAVARSRPLRSRGSEPGDGAAALRALAVEIAACYAPMLDELPTDDAGGLVSDLIDVGWIFAEQIGEERRLAYLDRAIELLRAEDDVTLAPMLQNTGRMRLAWTFDPVETLELIAWLRPLYELFGRPSDRLTMFYDEGTALGALGRPGEAVAALRAAVEIHYEHGGDDERHASVLTLLGVCLHECGDLAGAAGVLDDAAMIYRHLLNRNPEFAAELREVLGLMVLVQSLRGEDTSAALREIALLAPELGDADVDTDNIVKVVEIERAILKEGLSGLARAEQILAELRQEMERTLPPEPAALLVYLSSVSTVAIGRGIYGRAAEGLALLRDAFELADRYLPGTDSGPVRYLLLGARGQCHFAFGSVDDALHDLETAIDGLRQPDFEGSPGQAVMLYQTQFTLGRVHYATGRPADAEVMLRAALAQLDHRSQVADTNIARGTVSSLLAFTLIEQQRFDQALEAAGAAVECLRFQAAQAPLTLADAYHAEGTALTGLGRWQEALGPLQKAAGVLRSVPGDTSVLLAGLLELIGVCRVTTDGLGGWPPLREGTDLVHALRGGRWDAALAKMFPRHAIACFSRAECHYLRDEADDALRWITESMGALAHSPDQVVVQTLGGILQLWAAIVNDDNEPRAEVAERLREFGAFAAALAERAPEGVPVVGLRMLSILGGMVGTGRVPDEELDELDEEFTAELTEFLGLFDDEDDTGDAVDGAAGSPDMAAVLQAIGSVGRAEPGPSTVDVIAPVGPTAVEPVSGGFDVTAQRFIALGRLDLAADSLRLWAATLHATGNHAETSALMSALATLLRAVDDEPDSRFAASVAEAFTELAGLWASIRSAPADPG